MWKNSIEFKILEHVEDYCKKYNIPIDIRFANLGDENKFYISNTDYFTIDCISHYAKDIEDVKQLLIIYIDDLCENLKHLNDKIVLYIRDIVDMDTWYDVVLGGRIFTSNR